MRSLELFDREGKERRFYATRKTFATNLLLERVPVAQVAQMLGDRPTMVEEAYAEVVVRPSLDLDVLRERREAAIARG
jgi:hypothetical protein